MEVVCRANQSKNIFLPPFGFVLPLASIFVAVVTAILDTNLMTAKHVLM